MIFRKKDKPIPFAMQVQYIAGSSPDGGGQNITHTWAMGREVIFYQILTRETNCAVEATEKNVHCWKYEKYSDHLINS